MQRSAVQLRLEAFFFYIDVLFHFFCKDEVSGSFPRLSKRIDFVYLFVVGGVVGIAGKQVTEAAAGRSPLSLSYLSREHT
jgi:hypothetical protein